MRKICSFMVATLLLAALAACGTAPAQTAAASVPAASRAESASASIPSPSSETVGSAASAPLSQEPDGQDSAAAPADGTIRPEFQQAMDHYEDFIGEYCEFMQRYSDSDGTDLSMLADYADMMEQYARFASDFSAWESDELTAAELALYVEVQTRVSQKLLDAAA